MESGSIIGICAMNHFPYRKGQVYYRVHRLVVLPDYQGIGLGTRFVSAVAGMYSARGYMVTIVTSNFSMIKGLQHSSRWMPMSFKVFSPPSSESMRKRARRVKTASFKYRKEAVRV